MMRGLTVQQPYGTAIVRDAFAKDVENRTRNIAGAYRGPVAIHAGLAMPRGRRGARTVFPGIGEVERDLSGLLLRSERLAWPYRLPLGAIIGVVDLIDVHRDTPDGPPSEACWNAGCTISGGDVSWAMVGHWHLVLRNPRPLAHPIPWRGFLGLWNVPAELEARIREQVAA